MNLWGVYARTLACRSVGILLGIRLMLDVLEELLIILGVGRDCLGRGSLCEIAIDEVTYFGVGWTRIFNFKAALSLVSEEVEWATGILVGGTLF
jgi:hypothetical protein